MTRIFHGLIAALALTLLTGCASTVTTAAASPEAPPTFEPTSAPNLLLWLDGADSKTIFRDSAKTEVVASDRAPVGAWQDKSEKGHDATQETPGMGPTYIENVRNGRSALRFDGATQWLGADTFGPSFELESWNAFLVVQANSSSTNGSALMSSSKPSSHRRGFRYMPNCKTKRCVEYKSKHRKNEDIRTQYPTSGDWEIWEYHNDDGVVTILVDGDEKGKATTTPSALSGFTRTVIGGRPRKDDSANEIWDGHLGEIIFYGDAKSPTLRRQILDHLAEKWAIIVAPASSAP